MVEKALICFLAGWLLLIYVIRIYKRDEEIRRRGSGKMNWYEYLMSLGIDELAEFLGGDRDFAEFYCNGKNCPNYSDTLECAAFNKWCDKGRKPDKYPCVSACKRWLNSEKEGK